MSPKLCAMLAPFVIAAPGTIEAQDRWQLEIRGGPAFAIEDLGAVSLGTGFGFEGTAAYRIQPHVSVYAGWDWHRFPADATAPDPNSDFEETGYAFGLQFEHPIGKSSTALRLRAGGTYNHIEMENSAGDIVTDTGHGLGWEGGAGLALQVGSQWQITPGLRFRSLTRDVANGGGPATSADLRYLAVDLGISRRF